MKMSPSEDLLQFKLTEQIPGVTEFSNDVIVHGKNEIDHDTNFTVLCTTDKAHGLRLNTRKPHFKSKDNNSFDTS